MRTLHLRRGLRIGPPPGVLWGTLFLAAWPLMILGAFIWVKYFAPASVPQEYAAWGLVVLAGVLLEVLAAQG